MLPVQRALISVYDKRDLDRFARALTAMGIEILSTGGTRRFLEEAGIEVTPVSAITGFPEILDGRVKTLHPAIHAGILADRQRAGHLGQLQEHGMGPIDLVVVNLYPFEETAAVEGAAFEEVVEMIDVGGPAMIRGAAKNFRGVVVVVDPGDYPQVLAALEDGERVVPAPLRRALAIKAFRETQRYDAAIAGWLARQSGEVDDRFPRHLTLSLERVLEPRYGENPHQKAALYQTLGERGVLGGFEQLQGKTLSWNNLLDADAARRLAALVEPPAVVIVKHNNPCGVGTGDDLVAAYERALECDPLSAFGSVIALNRPAGGALAAAMAGLFVEVVIAPGFDDDARARFAAKKRLRLIECPPYRGGAGGVELRAVDGGFLAQTPDDQPDDPAAWTCVTRRSPSDGERRALALAWTVARGVRSNAIVIAKENQTVGIGAGQMSRVDACRLAVSKAQLPLAGTAAASDAFFPFRDGLDALVEAGVTAVVQPGGSRRDDEVIAAADEHGVAMLLTKRRHFRH
ncbi:MAG: bifunctional phosphoribosylaminoimidazolecarboxamide formyltransferase/IMP cyclohydrolase PurH [Acidobacteria bacterium]|nr:MAG: bifunctional phosphoribosylaminoimidazolecarboxamide formyltransferase/IMP cyclohydrolase PurH [Acidobacteriota bacterium]